MKMMRMRVLVMALVAAGILAGPAAAQAPDKVSLLLNWYTYGEHAPFYLGVVSGLYKQQNIDLDIQQGRGSGSTVQVVAAGTTDFGYADFGTMMKAASKGAPVEAVGMLVQKSPMSAMGFADKHIDQPKDIVGKTVILTPGDSFSQIFPVFLKVNGVPTDSFKTITGDAVTKRNAVISGQADLLLGNINDQKPTIEEVTGKPVHAILFADHGVNLLNGALFARKDFLKDHADLVRRFLKATAEAVKATEKDPAAAVAAILKLNPRAGKAETLSASLAVTMPLYHTAATAGGPPLRVADSDLQSTYEMMVQYGGVDKDAGPATNYYTNDYLP